MSHSVSAKFRAALKQELPAWVRDGIVSEEGARRLAQAYQLDDLTAESSRLLSAVIFTSGSLLLGGGLISFVAANWEDISTPLKLTLLFSALLGFHGGGYVLWHRFGWRRLGHALIFCGCLVFGANIGLIAQIFHISGDWYGAFGLWAVGSLAVAWAIRSWITGVLGLFTSFLWFAGFQNDGYEGLANLYPPAVAALFLPLAFKTASRALYASVLLCVLISTCVLAGIGPDGVQTLLALSAGGLLVWVLFEVQRLTGWRREFATITEGLGLVVLSLAAYLSSFHAFWQEPASRRVLPFLPLVYLALSFAASGWLMWRATKSRRSRRWIFIGILTVAAVLCGGGLLLLTDEVYNEVLFTVLANLAALTMAAVGVGLGIAEEWRSAFWLGCLLFVALIFSRFLEYETSLLLKSAAFIACGTAVILAGVWYEKYLRQRPLHAGPTGTREVIDD